MGTVIEIHLPTLDDKAVEGVVKDIEDLLKQYAFCQGIGLSEIHKRWVMKKTVISMTRRG